MILLLNFFGRLRASQQSVTANQSPGQVAHGGAEQAGIGNTHETPPGMNSACGKGWPSTAVMLNVAKNCAIMSQLESSEKYLPGHTLRAETRVSVQ